MKSYFILLLLTLESLPLFACDNFKNISIGFRSTELLINKGNSTVNTTNTFYTLKSTTITQYNYGGEFFADYQLKENQFRFLIGGTNRKYLSTASRLISPNSYDHYNQNMLNTDNSLKTGIALFRNFQLYKNFSIKYGIEIDYFLAKQRSKEIDSLFSSNNTLKQITTIEQVEPLAHKVGIYSHLGFDYKINKNISIGIENNSGVLFYYSKGNSISTYKVTDNKLAQLDYYSIAFVSKQQLVALDLFGNIFLTLKYSFS